MVEGKSKKTSVVNYIESTSSDKKDTEKKDVETLYMGTPSEAQNKGVVPIQEDQILRDVGRGLVMLVHPQDSLDIMVTFLDMIDHNWRELDQRHQ